MNQLGQTCLFNCNIAKHIVITSNIESFKTKMGKRWGVQNGRTETRKMKIHTTMSPPNSLPASLPVPLLDTRFGNLQALVHSTQPCKGCLLQIRPVVVICHLE